MNSIPIILNQPTIRNVSFLTCCIKSVVNERQKIVRGQGASNIKVTNGSIFAFIFLKNLMSSQCRLGLTIVMFMNE